MEKEFDIDKFIAQFESYREDNCLEVKNATGGLPGSLWESYSAFANSNGGVIILGVGERQNGTFYLSGLKNTEKLKKNFWSLINDPSKVSVNLLTDTDLDIRELPEGIIMVIHVPRARREDKPVYLNKDMFRNTYRRNGEGDYHCSRNEVLAMLRDQTEDTPDMKILEDMDLGVINTESFHAYRNSHRYWRSGHVWENISDEEYLERIEAARISKQDGKLHPTGAGLLMFGDEYKIHYEYPEYFLDYREMLDPMIRWTDRIQSGSGDWTGNLFDFYFRVLNKLTKDIKVPFKLDGVFRVDDTPVHKAIREALLNCIVNADFFLPRGIVIKKDRDLITMENPGYIRTGKSQMLKGGISDPRNKTIMKMFTLIGIGERAGSGVPDIYSVWENEGWEEPVVIEEYGPDRTILKLSMKIAESKNVVDNKNSGSPKKETTKETTEETTKETTRIKIINTIKADNYITVKEIAEKVGLSNDGVRYHINKMRKEGKLERKGSTKNGKWILH